MTTDQQDQQDQQDQRVVHDPLTTKEGWQRFVDDLPTPPPLPSGAHHQQLDPLERVGADQARLDYHARLITVATPTIRQVVTTGHRLMLLNRGQVSARRGLILTGQAATGKTTALTQLGRSHELQLRRRNPGAHARIPVLYVTVPPGASPRMLAAEFARFLGLPVPRRFNQADITNAVCDVCCATGCDLVLVDELHNLSLHTRAGAEASDQLKYLSERIPATFVYAGIDLEGAGLFAGIRGRQIAGRFIVTQSLPFAYATTTQRQEWRALVVSLEQALRLHDHRPGTLLRLAGYLHQRTGGMIGSLSHLLRGAAIEAIRTGTEQLTKPLLDTIPLTTTPSGRSAPHADTGRADLPGVPEQPQPWEQPARRLPVTLRPVHRETIGSYLARLAHANSIQGLVLARCLAPYQRMPTTVEDDTRRWSATTVQRLAVIAGQPLSSLRHALPGLTEPPPPPSPQAARRHLLRDVLRACQRCMAACGITAAVFVHGHPHQHLCVRHRRWLRALVQVDLTRLPEVVSAQQRHARLVRRHPPHHLEAAFTEAAEVVGAWYEAGWHPSLSEHWRARLRILGVTTWTRIPRPPEQPVQLATYPETVTLAGLLASPYWRANIIARTQTARFYQEAGRRLGLTYPNTGMSDPLALWARRLRRTARRGREGAFDLGPA